jgi:hypothetical protein
MLSYDHIVFVYQNIPCRGFPQGSRLGEAIRHTQSLAHAQAL